MKRSIPILIIAVGIAGLLGGFVMGREAGTRSASITTTEEPPPSKSSPRLTERERRGSRSPQAGPAARSTIRSTDTLEDLLAVEEDALYARMSLWLMDADPADIAAYWEARKKRPKQNRDIKDLVMIGWVRADPEGAIAAVAGTGDEHYAWWAWGCHDPAAALQTAIDTNPGRVGNVAWGIGEFHPKWLRENFAQIPDSGKGRALQGLVKWGESDDAMATLEFLKEHNRTPPEGLLRSLVRQDPWAAYEWFEQNGAAMGPNYGSPDQAMNLLIRTLADSDPDALQQLIDREPSGARKRMMEAAAFENLMALDLDAALAEAEATTAPYVGSERLAAVGLRLARTDPERAFEVAETLFTKHAEALENTMRVYYSGGGMSSSGSQNETSNALLNALVARDPGRLMEMFDATPEPEENMGAAIGGAMIGSGFGSPFTGASMPDHIAGLWAQQDLEGFAQWVVDRNDPAVTDRMAPGIINQLRNQNRFDEAAEWAAGMEGPRTSQLSQVLRSWQRVDPDQALQWLESADLPPEERNHLQRVLQPTPGGGTEIHELFRPVPAP